MTVDRILFNIKTAYGNLKRKKFVSLSIILSLVLGLLFPVLVLAFGSAIIEFLNSSVIKDFDKVILVTIKNGSLSEADIKKIMIENTGIDTISRYNYFQATIILEGDYTRSNVVALDSNYRELSQMALCGGKWLDTDGLSSDFVCIIGKNFAKKYFAKNSLGNKINILGNEFEIIGVTDNINFLDSIIIPMNCLDKLHLKNHDLTYYIKFKDKYELEKQAVLLKDFISDKFKFTADIKLYKDKHKDDINREHAFTTVLFAITGVVLLYALLNIINIIFNKVNEDRKSYGIKLALGASQKDIFMQNFFELIILSLLSSIIVTLATLIVIYIINNYIFSFFSISINIYIICVFICIIFSLLISFLMLRKITKLSIMEIYR